jgi:ketosteroid isomerase-like protein
MNTGTDWPADTDRLDVDRAAVARATTALLNAVNASDLTGVLATWSDHGVMMPPHHPSVHGWAALKDYFKDLFSHSRFEFVFSSSHIDVAGDVALERLEYTASMWPLEGGSVLQDRGKGLHVYRRQSDGSWKLALDIWNSDNPA